MSTGIYLNVILKEMKYFGYVSGSKQVRGIFLRWTDYCYCLQDNTPKIFHTRYLYLYFNLCSETKFNK